MRAELDQLTSSFPLWPFCTREKTPRYHCTDPWAVKSVVNNLWDTCDLPKLSMRPGRSSNTFKLSPPPLTHHNARQLLSDLFNFAQKKVISGKYCFARKGIRACCMGKYRMSETDSGKSEISSENFMFFGIDFCHRKKIISDIKVNFTPKPLCPPDRNTVW